MDIPSYDEVSELPTHLRQRIPAAFEDINGHLNVRHYLGIVSEGLDKSLEEVGIQPDWRNTRRAVFSVEHHLTYFHELVTGDEVTVKARLIGRSDKALHALACLVDETNQRIAYLMEEIMVNIDMDSRKSASWDPEIAERLDARIAEHQERAWAAPLCGAMSLR